MFRMSRKYSCLFYSLIVGSAFGVAAFTTTKIPAARNAPLDSKSPLDEEVIAAPILEPQDEGSSPPDDDDDFDPICRVVASSDNKLPPMVASKLSPSSKQLLEKIDLLYSAQSKKELRELSYLQPDSMPFDVIHTDAENITAKNHDNDQERKLISVLKRSLDDGGYKLMDKRDLDLCSALNAGYLLRLSLFPDLKNLDCIGKEFYPKMHTNGTGTEGSDPIEQLILDGKVLLFRRGYSKEITTGRLLLPKLDYLQTSLVQRSTGSVTRKLAVLERRIEEFVTSLVTAVNDYVQQTSQQLMQKCTDLVYDALDSVGLSNNTFILNMLPKNDTICVTDNYTPNGSESRSSNTTSKTTYVKGNKIFKLNRYELGNSFDISDATISPFLLCEMGNETSPVERDIYDAIDAGLIDSASIYNSSAVRLLERIGLENTVDFFSKQGRRKLVTNYFKYSTLLEPNYEEVVVIWRPSKKKMKRIIPPKWMYEAAKIFDMEDRMPILKNTTSSNDAEDEMEDLEIRAFNDVPMANILAVLPKNKLIFRPADAFVFDFVSLGTFLATAGSLKFDSPKLDLLALVTLVLFAVRTVSNYNVCLMSVLM